MIGALRTIGLSALLGFAWLFVAVRYGRMPSDGALVALAAWSAAGLYGVAGLVGGSVAGLLGTLERGFALCEAALRVRLQEAADPRDAGAGGSIPLAELRRRYEQVVDGMVAETVGRLPLPASVLGWFRGRIRAMILGEFLTDCERRGMAAIGLPEVRRWLVDVGLSHAAAPVYAQLRLWRGLVIAALVLLGALPIGLRLLA